MNLSLSPLTQVLRWLCACAVVACGGVMAQDQEEFAEMELNLRTAYAKIQTLEAALANAGGSPSLAVTSAAAAEALRLVKQGSAIPRCGVCWRLLVFPLLKRVATRRPTAWLLLWVIFG